VAATPFVPAARTLSGVSAGAAPFVPRGAAAPAPAPAPPLPRPTPAPAPAVAFLRGATRGGVPVSPGGTLAGAPRPPPRTPADDRHDEGLPADDEFFAGLTQGMASLGGEDGAQQLQQQQQQQQQHGEGAHGSPLLAPDGSVFYAPRGAYGDAAVAAAVGAVGYDYTALPQPQAPRSGAPPGHALHASRFASDALRAELARRAALCGAQPAPGSEDAARVPALLHRYHSLVPLEDALEEEAAPSRALGLRSAVVKAVSMDDGAAVALRRLDGAALPPSPAAVGAAVEAVARWAPLAGHPHVCALRDAFAAEGGVEGEGAPPCLYVAHEYAPGAVTLADAHCARGARGASEDQLWAAAVQVAAALRAVHAARLAARPAALAPSKVVVTAGGRLRLAALGLPDILASASAAAAAAAAGAPPPPQPSGEALQRLQRSDLVSLGHLLLTLGCGGGVASLPALASRVSPRLTSVVAALLEGGAPGGGGPGALRDVASLGAALGDAALHALSAAGRATDALLAECAREAEAGRALRTLLKLSFVLERGDGGGGDATGDRYLLHLFRDWLFNAPAPDGVRRPDWGHAYEALAKLDAGVPERILLLSRDEASMLVASYGDIKRCAEAAYAQMAAEAARADADARAAAMAAGAAQQQQH
jgi:PAB-dependent poly(A)-specific ribonuclease subunit 3